LPRKITLTAGTLQVKPILMKNVVYASFVCAFGLMLLLGQSEELLYWVAVHIQDFWAHYAIYSAFGIMITAVFYLEDWWVWWAIPLGCFIATLEEARQIYLPHRSFEWSDMAANYWGICTGFGLIYALVYLLSGRAPGINDETLH